ncbi:lysophospholipid acyltransferase family protein [Baaleninema simplex]|uniref:lysophospholipid acyltransferase family protein n=1 Tax=Baaleninema simplex TaxID=2862350 RepID=UPI000345E6CC|nr:1-acyl-sn-glycerol-3-phosphate acyltransferase [Baaleninema simplex]
MTQLNLPEKHTKTSKTHHSNSVSSRVSPWLSAILYPLAHYVVLPAYFRHIDVRGQENLPQSGTVILAPTHRSRWDPILVAYLAGRRVTGRDPRFMTSANETKGVQGWIVRRLGAFPVNLNRVDIASLRHGIDLLLQQEMLVIFPEANIFFVKRNIEKSNPDPEQIYRMKPGLGRLAMQVLEQHPDTEIHVVPISLRYSTGTPKWRCDVRVRIAEAMDVNDYFDGAPKRSAKRLMADLQDRLKVLHETY